MLQLWMIDENALDAGPFTDRHERSFLNCKRQSIAGVKVGVLNELELIGWSAKGVLHSCTGLVAPHWRDDLWESGSRV